MKLTLKNNNTKSFILEHSIVTQTISLLSGREESLQTEKDIYLTISFLSNLVEEDLIDEINKDKRKLFEIIEEDLEPFFLEVTKKEEYETLFLKAEQVLMDYYDKLYKEQHSVINMIMSGLETLNNLTEADKDIVLKEVSKLGSEFQKNADVKTFNTVVKKIEATKEESEDKLKDLVEKYQGTREI